MRVRVLRNLGKQDPTLPVEVRDLDLRENEVHDLEEPVATLLLERKLAEPDQPPRMRSTLAGRPPETPEARKAQAAREQQQRDAFAEPESALGHTGPVERTPEGHGTERKGVDPDAGTPEKVGTPKAGTVSRKEK